MRQQATLRRKKKKGGKVRELIYMMSQHCLRQKREAPMSYFVFNIFEKFPHKCFQSLLSLWFSIRFVCNFVLWSCHIMCSLLHCNTLCCNTLCCPVLCCNALYCSVLHSTLLFFSDLHCFLSCSLLVYITLPHLVSSLPLLSYYQAAAQAA